MTKIAVISDIHGNMEALDEVMANIESQGCDKVFVLGDYAMAGPLPRETVEFFMSKQNDINYTMIQGNTDLMIANYNENLYYELKEKAPVMAAALKSDVKELNDSEKEFLRNLPSQKEVIVQGIKFLLVHGSPRRNNEDILPTTPVEELKEMTKFVDADIVLCGHTHIPCGFQTKDKKTVINVGSVGRPFTPEPKACFLTIVVNEGKTVFEHHFVNYNKQFAYEILKKRDFWGADRLANTLLNPEERHF